MRRIVSQDIFAKGFSRIGGDDGIFGTVMARLVRTI